MRAGCFNPQRQRKLTIENFYSIFIELRSRDLIDAAAGPGACRAKQIGSSFRERTGINPDPRRVSEKCGESWSSKHPQSKDSIARASHSIPAQRVEQSRSQLTSLLALPG